jgi:Mg-chelatase subunit ChlD
MQKQEPLIEEHPATPTETEVGTLTVIVEVLDMSGSMGAKNFIDEVRGGYNAYIKKNIDMPGRAVVFTVLFDTEIKVVVNGIPVEEVPELTTQDYFARGGTALNDAVAVAISTVSAWIEAQPESNKPDHVVVEIQTDGEENSSIEYSRSNSQAMSALREIIAGKEAAGWVFSYIGTEGDVFAAAVSMGISREMAMATSGNMSKSATGNAAYFASKADIMTTLRSTTCDSYSGSAAALYSFSADQRKSMTDSDEEEVL